MSKRQFRRLLDLLPPERPRRGRPARDLARTVRAILWINRTGAPWRDLPEELGPWQTAANRFYRWRKAGVWDEVLDLVRAEADAAGKLDWSLHQVDTTVVRAHQHAAGAKGGSGARRSAARAGASRPSST
jgi:transposase